MSVLSCFFQEFRCPLLKSPLTDVRLMGARVTQGAALHHICLQLLVSQQSCISYSFSELLIHIGLLFKKILSVSHLFLFLA